jgi:hypothetical protein
MVRRPLTLTATEAFVYRGHAVRKGKTFQARVVDYLALLKRKKAVHPPPGTCDGVNTITATPLYRGQSPRPAIAYAVPVTGTPPAARRTVVSAIGKPPAPPPTPAPTAPVPPAPTPPTDPEIRRPADDAAPAVDEPSDDETSPRRRRYRRRDLEP